MVEMIPKINGEERREEGRFVLPEGEVRVFGAVAYVTVLEDRLAKIGLRRKWNYVEWKERETAAVCFNMLPKAGGGFCKGRGRVRVVYHPGTSQSDVT